MDTADGKVGVTYQDARSVAAGLTQGVAGQRMVTLPHLWQYASDAMGIVGFDAIVFVEHLILLVKPMIYMKDIMQDGLFRADPHGWDDTPSKERREGGRVIPTFDTALLAVREAGVSNFAYWWANRHNLRPTDRSEAPYFDSEVRLSKADAAMIERMIDAAANHDPVTSIAGYDAGDSYASYPDELRAAVEAFQAVSTDTAATAKQSPKAALLAWLEKNRPEIGANARERIAIVANWQPTGGAPKTPG